MDAPASTTNDRIERSTDEATDLIEELLIEELLIEEISIDGMCGVY